MFNKKTSWHINAKSIKNLLASLHRAAGIVAARADSDSGLWGLRHLVFIPLALVLLSVIMVSCAKWGSGDSDLDMQMTDTDGDGYINLYDVDDDGDGLIEITTADDFNMLRNNLEGTGISSIRGQQGETYGCGGGYAMDGTPITACNGYELVADITLSDYSSWEPIGSCTANNECEDAFNAIFEGNGHIISNVIVVVEKLAFGVGLFGAISPDSEIRNVHLRDALVVFEPTGEPYDVGILVGYGRGAYITGSSVVGGDIYTTAYDAGALIGDGEGATITYSYADLGIIKASSEVGGLIGGGSGANILYSCASASVIDGREEVGGLVGDGTGAMIISSYAIGDVTKGLVAVGSLVGEGENISIKDSYAMVDDGDMTCADMVESYSSGSPIQLVANIR